VAGQHLVRPDGTVGLGIYGGVYVAGMTLAEAKLAIERHLQPHMHNPQVSVDVLGYNSKAYYVIADGGGAGNQVYKMPSTGNDTVLGAIAQIKGLPTVSNSGKIWVARPSANSCNADQVLHVDWDGISMGGDTSTNYQLFPGDRLYVQSDGWIRFDTNFAKIVAPIERVLGIAILGNGAVRGIQNGGNQTGTGF
jgi:protein involved in polysaccharide export with SLBB domain